MKRHPALRQLSVDHHHGLVQARRLVKASVDNSKPNAKGAIDTAREFLAFFEEQTRPHFREEEEVLLPAFSIYADVKQEPLVEMLIEHVHINRLVTELAAQVREGAPSAETMRALGTMLQEHIRYEEHVVFPLIEQQMPDEALQALQAAITSNE